MERPPVRKMSRPARNTPHLESAKSSNHQKLQQHKTKRQQRTLAKPPPQNSLTPVVPVNGLKTRLRSIRRLLQRNSATMPADQQVALEREQQDLQQQLEDAEAVAGAGASPGGAVEGQQEQTEEQQPQKPKMHRPKKTKKEDDMISRYHMVRFFERKQAQKHLKRAEKGLLALDLAFPTTTHQHHPPSRELHNRKVDLMYTQYFPLLQPYSSLYADAKAHKLNVNAADDESAAETETNTKAKVEPKRDHPMWKAVESAMEAGTLQQLRDGRPDEAVDSRSKTDRGARGDVTSTRPKKDSLTRAGTSDAVEIMRKARASKAKAKTRPEPTMFVDGFGRTRHVHEEGDDEDEDEDSDGGGTSFFEPAPTSKRNAAPYSKPNQ